jgi:putative nucleotidyltransferase with HDIG domain
VKHDGLNTEEIGTMVTTSPALNGITREDAWALVTEYVKGESLRRHMLAVEAAMRAYARHWGEDEELWGVTGLIHDFDYEIHPDADRHPQAGAPILRERGYPEVVIRAILSHADYLDVPRESRMEKALYAVDELTGFIAAVALVRPTKAVADVTAQSVRKRMKDKAFARAVSREDMLHGAADLGVDFDEHVAFVARAMTGVADRLGLAGVPAAQA